MSNPTGDYTLCGWRVRSAIALPELTAWTGDDRAPDVHVVLGEPPPPLETLVLRTPIVQVDTAGRIRFCIEDVCDYLVENGDRITIAPKVRLTSPDIRLFLLGAGLGALCHQRGILPLHAAAVEVDGRAVLLAGASGAGKSTLAAAFLRRGHRLLSDDVAPLTLNGSEAAILPSLRRIRLWKDSAEQAEWRTDTLELCRDDLEKFSHPLDAAHVPSPLKPSALIHLVRANGGGDEIEVERLQGVAAVEAMRHQTYRWRTLVGLLTYAGALGRVSQTAALIPRHLTLTRPVRYSRLDATVDAILETVRACP